ncbi:aldo/keto reductase [Gluconobacter albidus]|uniref:2,5-diketo-D-gluconic acid reductase n=1 Tax=Gluconobacter albidus TaxID=318683 RepID=A0AAW3QWB2_9PROT|nr:aldo/keto reductase [Gluconobacter albidus]KXV38034.1 2,5-diketo-D-gluconic acid reductase [Gluconobacter albidus]GBQ86325.1 2,5-diketo-D-gluconate reductase [Gluconobacter albidus NBRC 3250]GLQ68011.1 oxidoreductase [Gluconobacter albidus]
MSSQVPSADAQTVISFHDGNTMPQIGLGVWQTPPDETADIVREAVKLGYRSVDTARLYKNEAGVGEGLEDHPEIFLTTKVWNDEQGYDNTLRAYEESARLLRRPVLDLYLIHWPMPDQGQYVETWKALVELKKSGRVKSIGVSNFEPEHLERIMDATGEVPVVNQIELHPDFQQRALREFHEKHNIRTEAWRPLGKGRVLSDERIGKIAEKHDRTPAQVVIRWHLQNGLIVIPKSVNPKRLAENLDVFGFVLDADDMQAIGGMDRADGRMGADPKTAKF